MSHYKDQDRAEAPSEATQQRARVVLATWPVKCAHEFSCDCFAYRQLLKVCGDGRLLSAAQHDMIEQLLLRGGAK